MADARVTGTLGGAASGAAMGTAILPGWGTAIGGGIGGLIGFMGGAGQESAKDDFRERIAAARQMIEQQRERTRLAQQQALAQRLGLMAPYNRFLGAIGGPGAQMDLQQATRPILPPSQNTGG